MRPGLSQGRAPLNAVLAAVILGQHDVELARDHLGENVLIAVAVGVQEVIRVSSGRAIGPGCGQRVVVLSGVAPVLRLGRVGGRAQLVGAEIVGV